jgi:hypothetical protein
MGVVTNLQNPAQIFDDNLNLEKHVCWFVSIVLTLLNYNDEKTWIIFIMKYDISSS